MSEGPRDDDSTIALRPGVVVGQRFADRYEVERLLGRGGMGSVFEVRDRAIDELVALKLLDAATAGPELSDRFRREVRLARRVTHRNAARTYDLGEWQGWLYLTMELVEGESLHDLARRQQIGPARAVNIAAQIAEGLAAAHDAGVVHRDLKPANVLIERGGRAVITDFGIARGIQTGDANTMTGSLLGTPAYMAPEQVAGQPVDGRSDLYALGLMLFELVTGKLPFRADTPMATALGRLTQAPPELAESDGLPAELGELLRSLLAREPEQRPTTAREVAARLRTIEPACAELEAGSASSAAPDEPTRTLGSTTSQTAASTRGSTTNVRTPALTALPTRGRALAVLPFRYRGPQAEAYVAEALTDELIDVLSTTRGLRVSASGATARFNEVRDPKTIGSELEVDVIVDGTVQVAGGRLRIAARLLDVSDGFQLWSERFDGALEDVFELQDKLGKRIAEALRVELEQHCHRGDASPEAIETYLRARAAARAWSWHGPDGALALYERCLELAPEFKPAMAGYAIAALRGWFMPFEDERDWPSFVRAAVERAREGAPELAETHLAIAAFAVQNGAYHEAALGVTQALRLAPTYAAAHDYLGRLQLEAGKPESGLRHLELAFELDPSNTWILAEMARYRALQGDLAGYDRHVARYVELNRRDDNLSLVALEIRVGTWFDDRDRIERAFAQLSPTAVERPGIRLWVDKLLTKPADVEQLEQAMSTVFPKLDNPRFRTLGLQISAEAAAYHGLHDSTERCLMEAAEGILVDLTWLDSCPLLAPLRERPGFRSARDLVRARAEGIWST